MRNLSGGLLFIVMACITIALCSCHKAIDKVTGLYGCTHYIATIYNGNITDTVIGFDTVYVTKGSCSSSCINVKVSSSTITESFQEEAQTATFFHNTTAASYIDNAIVFANNYDSISYTRSTSTASGSPTTIDSYSGRRIN